MLPGFRFLFATVVLAVSVLVFGLGAAALLRAAHEEFVSLPSWRLAQQPLLAPQFEMSAPTLAMLRIEAPAAKSMVETTRPQSPYLNAMIPDPPRPEPARTDAVRDRPETNPIDAAMPADAAAPKDEAPPVQAEQPSPVPASPAEAVASLNAQASIDAPAAAAAPAGDSTPEARPAGTSATETNEIDSIQSEPRQPEPKPTAAISSDTEASEPPASEAVPPAVRSSEATASDTIPQPVAKKATRPSARAAARRKHAIARARAAARQRAIIQQPYAPDPLSQIFGGSGGGNVPRPNSG
jgi:hypothetical protein